MNGKLSFFVAKPIIRTIIEEDVFISNYYQKPLNFYICNYVNYYFVLCKQLDGVNFYSSFLSDSVNPCIAAQGATQQHHGKSG